MKVRSELAIKREYGRVNREIAKLGPTSKDQETYRELCGVRQALGWVLNDHAMSPVATAIPDYYRRLKRKPKRKP